MVCSPEHGLVNVDDDPTFLQGLDVVLGGYLPDKSELVSIVEGRNNAQSYVPQAKSLTHEPAEGAPRNLEASLLAQKAAESRDLDWLGGALEILADQSNSSEADPLEPDRPPLAFRSSRLLLEGPLGPLPDLGEWHAQPASNPFLGHRRSLPQIFCLL
jgi:hypothetical protein